MDSYPSQRYTCINECDVADWNMNSTLQIPILSRYVMINPNQLFLFLYNPLTRVFPGPCTGCHWILWQKKVSTKAPSFNLFVASQKWLYISFSRYCIWTPSTLAWHLQFSKIRCYILLIPKLLSWHNSESEINSVLQIMWEYRKSCLDSTFHLFIIGVVRLE